MRKGASYATPSSAKCRTPMVDGLASYLVERFQLDCLDHCTQNLGEPSLGSRMHLGRDSLRWYPAPATNKNVPSPSSVPLDFPFFPSPCEI